MPHSQKVIRLKVTDNPPESAPKYPGKWSRKNENGILQTKMEFLQGVTNQWLDYVKDNPVYDQTYTADKAKVLICHLKGQAQGPNKVTHSQCKQLVTTAELRLQKLEHPLAENYDGAPEVGAEGSEEEAEDKEEEDNIDGGGDQLGGLSDNDGEEEEENSEDTEEWSQSDQKSRALNEMALEQLLSKTDEDIFESIPDVDSRLSFKVSNKKKFIKRREVYGKKICQMKTDSELFESGEDINQHVLMTEIYKQRKECFSEAYYQENLDGKSSQSILTVMSQTPQVVIESEIFKNRVSHLSKKEKSEKVAFKSVRDTLKALKENPSKAGQDQKKVIAASLTSLRFGPPECNLSYREEQEVTEMKRKLMTGEEKVLVLPTKPARQTFPAEVTQLAAEYWEQTTQPDPAMIRYPGKNVRDGQDTVPIRYQMTTNEEAYQSFKEHNADKVEVIMSREAKSREEKLVKRKDSEDKEYRLKYVRNDLPKKFPSQSWFVEQRPSEVKFMNDHTTGQCKVSYHYTTKND